MDSILRSIVVYFFLLALFRMTGKRSIGQISTFDFVLLLVVTQATQQGLLGEDFSLTNAIITVATLIALDHGLNLLSGLSPRLERWLEETPLVLVHDGRMLKERMRMVNVTEQDLLESARLTQGVMRLDQIRYAILERGGHISVIPRN